jgi:hypothetical protein
LLTPDFYKNYSTGFYLICRAAMHDYFVSN